VVAVILLIFPTVLAGTLQAQESDKIVSAMHQIADNWKAAIENGAFRFLVVGPVIVVVVVAGLQRGVPQS
jgi:hypothetical protein